MCNADAETAGIKELEATFADYVPLLNLTGYESYVFDISSLTESQYLISYQIREYDHGEKVSDDVQLLPSQFSNMILLNAFPEESRARVKPEAMASSERGIYALANKLSIGFLPVEIDSLQPVALGVENMGSRHNKLTLKPQYSDNDSVNGKKFFTYETRPFKVEELEMNEFTPLVLLGSIWYDDNIKCHRFCGEKYISPDMSSSILKYIPHYYVIGVVVTPLQVLP